jgi:hypothetical protein
VTRRRRAVAFGLVATIAAGLGPTAVAAGGALSITPATIEHLATPGPLGTILVTNTTSGAMKITIHARPWIQSRSGAVSPNRRATMGGVRVSRPAFVLAAGGRASVAISLIHDPPGGSAFGVVDVIGIPTAEAKATGVVLAYRLLSPLRLESPSNAQTVRLAVGAERVRTDAAVVAVRNAGDTIDTITGDASIRSAAGTQRTAITAVRILPGSTVDVPLVHLSRLRRGTYTTTLSLRQAGRTVVTVKRTLRIP